ncbi:MAG: hypothetical protein Q9225_002124, partial [Loekoesia sp. 1 TL-2023]
MSKYFYLFGSTTLWSATTCNGSPFRIRNRISKASTLVRSFSLPQLHQSSHPLPPLSEDSTTPPSAEPTPPSQEHLPSSKRASLTLPSKHLITPPQTPSPSPPQSKDPATINIQHANQGLSLLQSSLHSLNQNPPLARHLYIQAVVSLLQGLPPSTELTESEIATLRSALPPTLDFCFSPEKSTDDDNDKTSIPQQQHPSSLLSRSLSTITSSLLITTQVLIPYLRLLLSVLAAYDHEYGIHERVFAVSSAVAKKIWRSAAENVDAG